MNIITYPRFELATGVVHLFKQKAAPMNYGAISEMRVHKSYTKLLCHRHNIIHKQSNVYHGVQNIFVVTYKRERIYIYIYIYIYTSAVSVFWLYIITNAMHIKISHSN